MMLVNAPESSRHMDLEDIEKYSMGGMSEEAAGEFEEHLLICQVCRDRVMESDRYVRAMRGATRQLRHRAAPAARQRFPWTSWGFVALAAAILVLAVVALRPGGGKPEFAVSLFAIRGADTMAQAPAGAVLVLHPDLTALASPPPYRLQLVDAGGATVWQGTFPAAKLPPRHAGIYYLRLYSTGGELLREYGLAVK